MGGHSHWAGIKHKKAINDAKRGKVFTKILREISIAAKMSGGDPATNPRLRKAMDDARAANMPNDNVKRAVMKGTGQLPGVSYEEVMYEGFGPATTALIVEGTTDSKNRTFSEIRKIFSSRGGNLGAQGSVAYMFKSKGLIIVKLDAIKEEELLDIALEAGAEDIKTLAEVYEVITAPDALDKVKTALEAKNIAIESAEVTMIPDTEVMINDEDTARSILKLIDELEDHEDTKNVYSNYNIDDAILAKIENN